jgi:glycosyltransferase involved in cell wall biosynthesis
MRILYLNPNGSIGGAERALLDLIAAVRRARPNWSLDLIAGGAGDFPDAARKLGINVHVLPFPQSLSRIGDAGAGGPAGDGVSTAAALAGLSLSAPRIAVYAWKLRQVLSERQPHVIHSNGFKTHILAAWAAPRSSRVVWHVHDYAGARPLMSRLMRAHAGRCDIAIANSNSVARDLAAVCGARLRIRTVYNAVDLERFTPCGPKLDLDTLCALPPAPPATVRVGLVATMARWKGHEVFLRALSLLDQKPVGRATAPAISAAPAIRGYIIGGPIYATRASQYTIAELRAVAAKIGLNGNIGFTGYVKDAPAAIRALDIVVHASTQPEPFGLAVAEAMACGKPVVASNAGGIGEIIRENESALSHKPGDAQALARTIERLAGEPDLCCRLGTQARREAQARFDQDRLAREAVAIYAAPSFRLVNTGTGIPVSR